MLKALYDQHWSLHVQPGIVEERNKITHQLSVYRTDKLEEALLQSMPSDTLRDLITSAQIELKRRSLEH